MADLSRARVKHNFVSGRCKIDDLTDIEIVFYSRRKQLKSPLDGGPGDFSLFWLVLASLKFENLSIGFADFNNRIFDKCLGEFMESQVVW